MCELVDIKVYDVVIEKKDKEWIQKSTLYIIKDLKKAKIE